MEFFCYHRDRVGSMELRAIANTYRLTSTARIGAYASAPSAGPASVIEVLLRKSGKLAVSRS